MGATNEIKQTNIGHALVGKTCSQCNKDFTNKDILENNNWMIDFDTSNDVKLEDNEIKGYGYNLTIWLRDAYHEECDKAEEKKNLSGFHGGAIKMVMDTYIKTQQHWLKRRIS